MYDTESVFNILAADDQDRRTSSRRALALARARLDNTLGGFLRGAVTSTDFQARLAVVGDELALHVAEACSEVGCDEAEHIASVLVNDYHRNRRWQPILAQDIGEKVDPGEDQDSNDGKGVLEPHQDDADVDAPKIKSSAADIRRIEAGVDRSPGRRDVLNEGWPQDDQGWHDHFRGLDQDFGTTPDSPLHHDNRCPLCGGRPGVPVPAPQDPYTLGSARTAEEGNTDLGAPEPKMDKRLWTPQNLGDPDVDDGRWPTERIDMTEPIGPPNNEHEPKGIGEDFTETQSLPSNSGDAGYDAGGPGPAPHTDTWSGTSGLADPVTNADLS